jgi:hypothetical protein
LIGKNNKFEIFFSFHKSVGKTPYEALFGRAVFSLPTWTLELAIEEQPDEEGEPEANFSAELFDEAEEQNVIDINDEMEVAEEVEIEGWLMIVKKINFGIFMAIINQFKK